VRFPGNATDSSAQTVTSLDGSLADWLYFMGHWGNDALPEDNPRQAALFGFKTPVGGPTRLKNKRLNGGEI